MTSEELTAIGDVMETKLDSFRKDAFVPFREDMKNHVTALHTELSKHTEILANHGARIEEVEAGAKYAEKIAKDAEGKALAATTAAQGAETRTEGIEEEIKTAKNHILWVGFTGLVAFLLFILKNVWTLITTGKVSG